MKLSAWYGLLCAAAWTRAVSLHVNEDSDDSWVVALRGSRPIPGGSPLARCDVEEDHLLDVQEIEITPNPPQRGKNLTVEARGDLFGPVEDGAYVIVEVRLGYIKLLSETFDLCKELDENDLGLQCPLAEGEYELAKTVEIPQQVPPGRYHVVARAYTVDDELITCLTGDVYFPPVMPAERVRMPRLIDPRRMRRLMDPRRKPRIMDEESGASA
ncbi:AaceriAER201Cp [[Ashbya] aceris (nom. inval.)]|nr:AaceriAER201Cp [[Ashbya] aceris (nom. inval.)]